MSLLRCLILGLGLGVLLAPPMAAAQGAAPTVAIVDFHKVARESQAMTGVRQQLDGLQRNLGADTQAREQRLRALDDDLQRQKDVLSPEVFEQRRREFEREFLAARSAIQERQQRMERAYGTAMREIERKIVEVTGGIAREKDIAIVFGVNAIVIAENDFDITEQVLRELNAVLPSVTLQLVNN